MKTTCRNELLGHNHPNDNHSMPRHTCTIRCTSGFPTTPILDPLSPPTLFTKEALTMAAYFAEKFCKCNVISRNWCVENNELVIVHIYLVIHKMRRRRWGGQSSSTHKSDGVKSNVVSTDQFNSRSIKRSVKRERLGDVYGGNNLRLSGERPTILK